MRQLFGPLALLAATSILAAGCSDSPTTAGPTPLSARLDGKSFVATDIYFSTPDSGAGLFITGGRQRADGGWRVVAFQLMNWSGPGTYDLDSLTLSGGGIGYVYDTGPNDSLIGMWSTTAAATGQAVVTEFDQTHHIVRGTFRFEARDSVGGPMSITQGVFAGRYTIER